VKIAGPAYVVRTPRLVLRCYHPADAELLDRSIDESREHLRPYMPWAARMESIDEQIAKLRRFRAAFDAGEDFIYGIFDRDERALLGGTGLHPRIGRGGLEIGYWIHVGHLRRGYATESSAALTRVAFEMEGVDRVEIHCDPNNAASSGVAAKLGFRHEATLRRRRIVAEREPRDTMVWVLFADE
jgi:RimJ/RimL family protein N-acetyltransferase